MEDQNKLIELHEDTKDDKDKEDNICYNNDDGKFKCKLCLHRLDGYHKSKLHYVKEHRTYINNSKKGNMCERGFLYGHRTRQMLTILNYYKNMLDL